MIGPDRLPTFDDLPNLPFCTAVGAECLRWRPIAVLGGASASLSCWTDMTLEQVRRMLSLKMIPIRCAATCLL